MSTQSTIYFNSGNSNGRRTTFKGWLDIVRNDTGTDLYVRGPKWGLRHIVSMPWHEALNLGKELVRLHNDKNP